MGRDEADRAAGLVVDEHAPELIENTLLAGTVADAPPPVVIPDPELMPAHLAPFAQAASTPVVDTIDCPRCAETIKARAKVCRFCGFDFDKDDHDEPRGKFALELGRERRSRVGARSSGRIEVHHHVASQGPSPGVAAVLSFFIAGAGQIYCGRVGRGLLFFFGLLFAVAGLASFGSSSGGASVLLGPVVATVMWVVNIVDASMCATDKPAPGADGGGRLRRFRRR